MSLLETYNALTRFAEVFGDGHFAAELGQSLTCAEIEALAGLFEVLDRPEAAQLWRESHAWGDDRGDDHNMDGTLRSAVRVGVVLVDDDHSEADVDEIEAHVQGFVAAGRHHATEGRHRAAAE